MILEVKIVKNVFILEVAKIIESGGLLFQSIHQDSKDIFKDLFSKTCFISIQDMRDKIDYFLKNSDKLENLFSIQQNNFESDDLNYKTIKNRKLY